ncbi:MAG: PilZ domain-containing protein [Rhodanobacter sp.]
MSQDDPTNLRRSERKRVNFTAIATDVINGRSLGHLGNLSADGLMLISSQAPRSEALYQISMTLPEVGMQPPPRTIELGIQEQWQAHAASPGQIWAGFRIVAISDADASHLEAWLAQA